MTCITVPAGRSAIVPDDRTMLILVDSCRRFASFKLVSQIAVIQPVAADPDETLDSVQLGARSARLNPGEWASLVLAALR